MPRGWSLFPLFLNTIKICQRGINIKWAHRGTRQPQRVPRLRAGRGEDERRARVAAAAAVPGAPGEAAPEGGPADAAPRPFSLTSSPFSYRAGHCCTTRSRFCTEAASASLPVAAGAGSEPCPAQRGARQGPGQSTGRRAIRSPFSKEC